MKKCFNLSLLDILTLLPTYIENTKDAIAVLSRETKDKFTEVEELLVDKDEDEARLESIFETVPLRFYTHSLASYTVASYRIENFS